MKNKKKIWLVSYICIGAGAVLLILGLILGGRPGFYINGTGVHAAGDNTGRNAGGEIKEGSKKLEAFQSAEISVDYADIEIIPSDKYAVEYSMYSDGGDLVCEVKNGKLTFRERIKVNFFNFNTDWFTVNRGVQAHYVKLYMPVDGDYSMIKLETGDGNISVPELNADILEINNDYGSVNIDSFIGGKFIADQEDGSFSAAQLKADTLEVNNAYGSIAIESLTGKRFSVDQDDGDLTLAELMAEQVNLNNEYGDITIKNGAGKTMNVDMADGSFTAEKLDYDKTEIDNEYGNVTVGLTKEPSEYILDLRTEYGDILLDGYQISDSSDDTHYKSVKENGKKLYIDCADGDIQVSKKK